MAARFPLVDAGTERNDLPAPSGRAAKADLRPHAREAMRDACGKQGAAARDIGISEGRLSSKLEDGSLTLAQIGSLGPGYARALARRLLDAYGTAADSPAMRLVRIESALRELAAEVARIARDVGAA